jgi:hypothetical protein
VRGPELVCPFECRQSFSVDDRPSLKGRANRYCDEPVNQAAEKNQYGDIQADDVADGEQRWT